MKAILFTLFAVIAGISAMAVARQQVTTEQTINEGISIIVPFYDDNYEYLDATSPDPLALKYQCYTLRNAAEYGRVEFCLEHGWRHFPLGKRKDRSCNKCKNLVARTHRFRSHLVQQQLETFVRDIGKSRYGPYFYNDNDSYVTEIMPSLLLIIKSGLDSERVCLVSRLCNPDRAEELISRHFGIPRLAIN